MFRRRPICGDHGLREWSAASARCGAIGVVGNRAAERVVGPREGVGPGLPGCGGGQGARGGARQGPRERRQ
eukprot:4392132-Lingulodinium_polyedra.AAC.1